MRLLRGLLGSVLWLLACVLGLVGVVLCVTVILLPLGIPLVMLSGRLIARSVHLMMPRLLAHPVNELAKSTKKNSRRAGSVVSDTAGDAVKKGRKVAGKQRKRLTRMLR